MERLHTKGGEAVGERRKGEDAVAVKETTRVSVYSPLVLYSMIYLVSFSSVV